MVVQVARLIVQIMRQLQVQVYMERTLYQIVIPIIQALVVTLLSMVD